MKTHILVQKQNQKQRKRKQQSRWSHPKIFVCTVSVSAWTRKETKVFHENTVEFMKQQFFGSGTARIHKAGIFRLKLWPYVRGSISGGYSSAGHIILVAKISICKNKSSSVSKIIGRHERLSETVRWFVGKVQFCTDEKAATLSQDGAVASPVYPVLLKFSKDFELNFIKQDCTLVGFLPV